MEYFTNTTDVLRKAAADTEEGVLHMRTSAPVPLGIVIPCYNEERLLLSKKFFNFVADAKDSHICFVNCGSDDTTLQVIRALQRGRGNRISICDSLKEVGRSEAVRLGMLQLANEGKFDYLAYIEPALITDYAEFISLVSKMDNPEYQMVSVTKTGGELKAVKPYKGFAKVVNYITRNTLGSEFHETQCGAMIMTTQLAMKTMKEKFLSDWFFNAEIRMRMNKNNEYTGKELVAAGSRYAGPEGHKNISLKDCFTMVGQLKQIAIYYK